MLDECSLLEAAHGSRWPTRGKGSYNESGTWITCDSKQSILEVADYTSANNQDRIFVSTLTVHHAITKNQDKEGIAHEQMQVTLLKFERSKVFDARAECAGRVGSRVRRKSV